MRTYLQLFEDVLRAEVREMGPDAAYCQARNAGLDVSPDGHVLSCSDDPQLVLLRLIRYFTSAGSMPALVACTPLINEILHRYEMDEIGTTPNRSDANATARAQTGGSSSGEA